MYRPLSIAAALLLAFHAAQAHEGHDHGADAPSSPVGATHSPRTSTASDRLEAVVVLSGTQLLVHLDDYASNAPVAGAAVDVVVGNREATAAQRAPGEYVVDAGALGIVPAEPARHALTLVVTTADYADLLAATLDVTATLPAENEARVAGAVAWWAVPVLLLLGGIWWWRYRLNAAREIR
ncbi:MAG: hypothetical protein ACLGHG_04935 [Gammaproteobacteria bacterium]